MASVPRVQSVVFPILRAALPGVTFTSWIPDVDKRVYPLVNIRNLGGRSSPDNRKLRLPVIEITAYAPDTLEAAQDLADNCLDILDDAVYTQKLTSVGYLHSIFITFPPSQFDSPFDGVWRVQTLVQLGVRPLA